MYVLNKKRGKNTINGKQNYKNESNRSDGF